MIRNFLNAIGRLTGNSEANSKKPTEHEFSKEQLIQWACGCMWEGLPDDFYEAYVEYVKEGESTNKISHRFKLTETSEYEKFIPADLMYPAQCIEHLDKFLSDDDLNWHKCKIVFNPNNAHIEYEK